MRGKQAAGVPTPCIRPQQIVTLLENNNFKLTQCYSHSSQPSQAAWQSHLERWRIGSQSQINAKLPSLLPLLCLRANTRPGWVMLFRDQTLGMTPLPSPLKSRRIKMQPNSAISLRALQQRQLADNKRNKSSTFTTRAA